MTEADKEIIEIVKELFRSKKNELVDPDNLLREYIVKWSIYICIICVVALALLNLFGKANEHNNGLLSGVIGVAFTMLFIHLNIKSKNPSLILYVLTWLSLMISLWLAS